MMYMKYLSITSEASSGKTVFWVLNVSSLNSLMSSQRQETSDLFIYIHPFWKAGGKKTQTVRGLQEEASLQGFSVTRLVCLLPL